MDAAIDPLRVLRVLMEGLSSEPSTGLWLTHFKAVPVARAVCPFDLIYLDKDHCVLQAVSLTVDSGFEPFEGEPVSALVLPSSLIKSSQTERGDQMVVVAAPENVRAVPGPSVEPVFSTHLPARSGVVAASTPVSPPSLSAADDSLARYLSGTAHLSASMPEEVRASAIPPQAPVPSPSAVQVAHTQSEVEVAPLTAASVSAVPEIQAVEYYQEAPPTLRMRVLRWLRLQPPPTPQPANRVRDRRRAYRLTHPDLVAYFFTGGAPQPHRIENISVTGFLMHSDDMWMPGTVIRMTLQKIGTRGDRHGDAVTVLTRMVRRVGGGSAFEFVFSQLLD
ncbi:MAG: hypothetical protein P4L40_20135 [Terracidiphilus sp.]|nr:hypothetical protein [Terracidiphilus sp.]